MTIAGTPVIGRMEPKPDLLVLALTLAFCWFGSTHAAAQRPPTHAVLAATLSAVDSALRVAGDTRVQGPIAFDPRVLRAPRGRAPAQWTDSLSLTWAGFAWDSVRPPAEVAALVQAANGTRGPGRWVTCGTSCAPPCHTGALPAVVAASEPWISGDQAQVLVVVAYRSSSTFHPHAWMANLLRFREVNGEWVVAQWHNWAST